jgi:hypothetical protein
MSFIRIDDVGDGNIPGLHRGDDRIAFGHFASHVVEAVKDKHWPRDIVELVDGRALGEQLSAFLRAGIAITAIPVLGEPGPVGRPRFQRGLQIGNADYRDRAAENIRRERRADKGGEAAVGLTEDRDLVLFVRSPP